MWGWADIGACLGFFCIFSFFPEGYPVVSGSVVQMLVLVGAESCRGAAFLPGMVWIWNLEVYLVLILL